MASAHTTLAANSDAVGHVTALLVRFPEIATIASQSASGSIVLSFVVSGRLDRAAREATRETVGDHVRTLLAAAGEEPRSLAVICESHDGLTFIRITRDAVTLTREELDMLTALFVDRFGQALVKSPTHDDPGEEDRAADDERVDYALDALRDSAQQKSLVGFHEEKRVVVYFLKRKKAKAAAR